jgi:exo-beta-1,3-glucanase (GH17 family)/chitodextrinase
MNKLMFAALALAAITAEAAVRGNLTINNTLGANYEVGQSWTLALAGAPADTAFSLCGSWNSHQALCIPNFDRTDGAGSWRISGRFEPAVRGAWTEWIEFSSGASSNRISFHVGLQAPGSLTINDKNGGTFEVGQSWTLSLTRAPANSFFALCGSYQSEEAGCVADFGRTDANGSWRMSGRFEPAVEGGWTEWIQFPSGALSNRISFTVGPMIKYALFGINFSPYVGNQDPAAGIVISEAQIRERLSRIAAYTTWIRTYGCTHGSENIPKIARAFGLRTAIGAWLDRDTVSNEEEIRNLITLIKDGQVDIGIIGNEVMSRGDLTESELLNYIAEVRQAAPQAILAVADTYSALLQHPNIVGAADVVFAHHYPFWDGESIDDAMAYLHRHDVLLRNRYPSKEIIVGETGWPSGGASKESAVPSPENAARYFLNFVSWARALNRKYYYFEAFDEAWKIREEGAVGTHWGVWTQNGETKPGMKDVFDGKTVPDNWSGSPSPQDTAPPSVPEGLAVYPASATRMELSWLPSRDNVAVAGYTVYRNGVKVASVTATSYRDDYLFPSTSYSYAVAAFDAAGNSSAACPSVSGTTLPVPPPADTTPPSTPPNVSAALVSPTQATISWSASSDNVGVAGYKVYRNSSLLARTTALSYVDSSLIAGAQYFYNVSAYDAAGNESMYSDAVSLTAACTGLPGGPGTPSIQFTYVPPKGNFNVDDLRGTVWHLLPSDHYVAVFIRVRGGWWIKPYFSSPQTLINCDGSWSCDITTGGVDEEADQITAYVFKKGYPVPLLSGQPSLPPEVDANAAAKTSVTR